MNWEYTLNRLPVNWENGMMISQAHLVEMNHYIASVYRNSLLNNTNPYNYGLLPAYNNKFKSINIHIEKQGENLFVNLERCYALTFDGLCFYINPETVKEGAFEAVNLTASIDLLKTNYNYVLLYIVYKPEELKKVGAVDIEKDDFERKPYLNVDLKLTYTYIESINEVARFDQQGNSFPVGIINVANKENPMLEKRYIPPCINFYSNKHISAIYDNIRSDSMSLLENASQVLNFVHEDSKGKLTSELVMDMELLLKNMLPIIAEINASFKTDLKAKAPINMVFLFKKLALTFMSNVDSLDYRRKREIGDYFAAQYGTPNDLAKIGLELIESNYSHADLFSTGLYPLKKFLDILLNLMKQISAKGLKTKVFAADNEWEEDVKTQNRQQVNQTNQANNINKQIVKESQPVAPAPVNQQATNPNPDPVSDNDLWGNMVGD